MSYRLGHGFSLNRLHLRLFEGELLAQGRFRQRGDPRLEARVTLQGVRIPTGLLLGSAERMRLAGERLSAELRAVLDRKNLALKISTGLEPSRAHLEAEALVPVRYSGASPFPSALELNRPTALKGVAHHLDLALLEGLVAGLSPLEGRAELAFAVNGPLQQPTASFSLQLQQARLALMGGALDASLRFATDENITQLQTKISQQQRQLLGLTLELKQGATALMPQILAGKERRWEELLAEIPLRLSVCP
jgi:hypothetical protein